MVTKMDNKMNGLEIDINEFKKMKPIQRDEIIYKNLIHIRNKIGDYNFHKKIQYVWLVVISGVLGFKKIIGL